MTSENRSKHNARYAVIHKPTSNTSALQFVRDKYDPTAALIRPHVTLVFPFSTAALDQYAIIDLIDHISSCAAHIEPFDAHFSRTDLSWDQWLFLVADAGRDRLVLLHDQLYTGMLRPLLREDIPFVPHISLGYLGLGEDGPDLADPVATSLDDERYQEILGDVETININCDFRVAEIQLIEIGPQFESTTQLSSFPLGA